MCAHLCAKAASGRGVETNSLVDFLSIFFKTLSVNLYSVHNLDLQ